MFFITTVYQCIILFEIDRVVPTRTDSNSRPDRSILLRSFSLSGKIIAEFAGDTVLGDDTVVARRQSSLASCKQTSRFPPANTTTIIHQGVSTITQYTTVTT